MIIKIVRVQHWLTSSSSLFPSFRVTVTHKSFFSYFLTVSSYLDVKDSHSRAGENCISRNLFKDSFLLFTSSPLSIWPALGLNVPFLTCVLSFFNSLYLELLSDPLYLLLRFVLFLSCSSLAVLEAVSMYSWLYQLYIWPGNCAVPESC